MSIFHAIFHSWRRVLAAFEVSDHQTLLAILCDAYRAEVNAFVQCTQHANQMAYPQFRAELLRIAAEVQAHLPWLHKQILALGGSLPSSSLPSIRGRNSWECLRRDVEETNHDCVRLLEWIRRIEREEPAIAAGLRRIRQDKLRHREEFRHMFMKSDPYTLAPTGLSQARDAQQKQAWLEQRKNDWMDHERAAWEIEGKQPPWAEWSGEQEFKWETELPHHNREWRRHLAEQRDTEMHHLTP